MEFRRYSQSAARRWFPGAHIWVFLFFIAVSFESSHAVVPTHFTKLMHSNDLEHQPLHKPVPSRHYYRLFAAKHHPLSSFHLDSSHHVSHPSLGFWQRRIPLQRVGNVNNIPYRPMKPMLRHSFFAGGHNTTRGISRNIKSESNIPRRETDSNRTQNDISLLSQKSRQSSFVSHFGSSSPATFHFNSQKLVEQNTTIPSSHSSFSLSFSFPKSSSSAAISAITPPLHKPLTTPLSPPPRFHKLPPLMAAPPSSETVADDLLLNNLEKPHQLSLPSPSSRHSAHSVPSSLPGASFASPNSPSSAFDIFSSTIPYQPFSSIPPSISFYQQHSSNFQFSPSSSPTSPRSSAKTLPFSSFSQIGTSSSSSSSLDDSANSSDRSGDELLAAGLLLTEMADSLANADSSSSHVANHFTSNDNFDKNQENGQGQRRLASSSFLSVLPSLRRSIHCNDQLCWFPNPSFSQAKSDDKHKRHSSLFDKRHSSLFQSSLRGTSSPATYRNDSDISDVYSNVAKSQTKSTENKEYHVPKLDEWKGFVENEKPDFPVEDILAKKDEEQVERQARQNEDKGIYDDSLLQPKRKITAQSYASSYSPSYAHQAYVESDSRAHASVGSGALAQGQNRLWGKHRGSVKLQTWALEPNPTLTDDDEYKERKRLETAGMMELMASKIFQQNLKTKKERVKRNYTPQDD